MSRKRGEWARVARILEEGVEADCEDQALVATDRCTRWGCNNAKLEQRGIFWCCPKCMASYGENPHPDCPPIPFCPRCAYTRLDCAIHMDHHLCGLPEPARPSTPMSAHPSEPLKDDEVCPNCGHPGRKHYRDAALAKTEGCMARVDSAYTATNDRGCGCHRGREEDRPEWVPE